MLLLNKAQFEEFDVFARVTEFKLIENLGTSSFSGTGPGRSLNMLGLDVAIIFDKPSKQQI